MRLNVANLVGRCNEQQLSCRRPYRVECTGSLLTSEVKQRRARSVLGWGTAWEDLRVLSAFAFLDMRLLEDKGWGCFRCWDCVTKGKRGIAGLAMGLTELPSGSSKSYDDRSSQLLKPSFLLPSICCVGASSRLAASQSVASSPLPRTKQWLSIP